MFEILRREEGSYTFNIAAEQGQYSACFTNNGMMGGAKDVKFSLDEVDQGKPPAATDAQGGQIQLNPLENAIADLSASVSAVMREQEYLKARERVHRDTSESTNERVLWYSVAEIALLIFITVYQIYSLMRFFEVKKSY